MSICGKPPMQREKEWFKHLRVEIPRGRPGNNIICYCRSCKQENALSKSTRVNQSTTSNASTEPTKSNESSTTSMESTKLNETTTSMEPTKSNEASTTSTASDESAECLNNLYALYAKRCLSSPKHEMTYNQKLIDDMKNVMKLARDPQMSELLNTAIDKAKREEDKHIDFVNAWRKIQNKSEISTCTARDQLYSCMIDENGTIPEWVINHFRLSPTDESNVKKSFVFYCEKVIKYCDM
jgi:hypothetical protein